MEEGSTKTCAAVNVAVALLRDKWTILCLGALTKAEGPLRYNAIQRAVGGISQRMLTLTLKTLEENGLVKRTAFPTVPPRVDYELTAVGRTLGKPLKALLDWSLENCEAMEEARRAYQRSTGHIGA
jgi:DNA-binding HxlR family transcriptional regulator